MWEAGLMVPDEVSNGRDRFWNVPEHPIKIGYLLILGMTTYHQG